VSCSLATLVTQTNSVSLLLYTFMVVALPECKQWRSMSFSLLDVRYWNIGCFRSVVLLGLMLYACVLLHLHSAKLLLSAYAFVGHVPKNISRMHLLICDIFSWMVLKSDQENTLKSTYLLPMCVFSLEIFQRTRAKRIYWMSLRSTQVCDCCVFLYIVSQKKLCRIVSVRTSSNYHQF